MKKQKKGAAGAAPECGPAFVEASTAIARARALGEAEQWSRACEALRPLAESVPGAVDLWLQIAQWERQGSGAGDAQATLRHAIELNSGRLSNLAALWHALAGHLFESQEWSQAAQAAQAGLDASRELARAVKNPRSAEAEGVSLNPGDWARGGELKAVRLREHELLEMLATSRAHEGRFEAAGQAMRGLLSLSPRDPLHRMRLASLLQSHGALGEASREFERVLEMVPNSFFARDAEAALELLDKAQIQQILTRAGEQRDFGLRLERDMDDTLDTHAFYLSESGRESLRQMIDDGRPDLSRAPRVQ